MTDVAAAASATGTPPAPPSTPAEAAARLAERRADKAWGEKLMSSDKDTLAEFHALAKQASDGSDLDTMILAAPDLPDLTIEGKLSPKKVAGEIPALRESGLSDGVIKELLEGRESTPQEVDAVKRLRAARHKDPKWVEAYLRGEHDQVRESRLMSMVLMQAPA